MTRSSALDQPMAMPELKLGNHSLVHDTMPAIGARTASLGGGDRSIIKPDGGLVFNHDIYPDHAPVSPKEFQPVLDKASKINFTTEASDKTGKVVPDYILGDDGKLRKNPDKKTPNKDGSVNIEVQTANKSETDAKKAANDLQRAWAQDMITRWQNSPDHKGEAVPPEWQALVTKQADVPAPAPAQTPPPEAPQPQADQTPQPGGGGGGSSGGGGGSSGGGGGGDGGGGGGSRGGGGGGTDSGSGGRSSGGGTSYDGASTNATPQTVLTNAAIVAEVAKEKGVDPATALASMLVESRGDNTARGDGNTSFGLFQLHQGGELPAGMSAEQAFDPRKNAEIALSVFAQHGGIGDPGQLAAASQRPADPSGYAQKVDAALPEARQLLAQIQQQGGTQAVIAANEKGGMSGGGIPAVGQLAVQDSGQALWAKTDMAGVTENGNLGCAAAVSYVYNQAGIDYLHDASVVGLVAQAKSHGWQEGNNLAAAKPGDIIYGDNQGNDQHVGIVGADGKLWNNNSSDGKWHSEDITTGYIATHFGSNAHVVHAPDAVAQATTKPKTATG